MQWNKLEIPIHPTAARKRLADNALPDSGGFEKWLYAWLSRKPSKRSKQNQRILSKIAEVYTDSKKAYGSPRVHAALKRQGYGWGRNRIARIMRSAGLKALRQYCYKRKSLFKHGRHQWKNLLKQRFDVPTPNKVWASDITQFWTGTGWLYLAVTMDLFSRRIIGWSMRSTLREELVIDSLEMAIQTRADISKLTYTTRFNGFH